MAYNKSERPGQLRTSGGKIDRNTNGFISNYMSENFESVMDPNKISMAQKNQMDFDEEISE